MSFRHSYRAVLSVAVLSFSTILMGAPVASAADPVESITMSPVSKIYQVNAGQTLTDSLTILNDGQTAYDFTVYATPYSVTNAFYDPNFSADKPNADAYGWITFQQTTYHAEPRQTLTIPYTIHVKTNAAPGGHYGAIFAEVQPAAGSGQLARKKRVGALIYATVKGDVHLSGKVVSMDTPWFQTVAPMLAHSRVQNTGNSDFQTTVRYQVSDLFGHVAYASDTTYEVLPDTTRQMDMQWSGAEWFGLYKVQTTVKILGKTTTHNSYVMMVPVWLILLLALAVILGVVYGITRKAQRHQTTE